jgi:SAM-dependent methyltransferase
MPYDDHAVYDPPRGKCPLCGGGRIFPLYEITRYRHPFRTDRCSDCGFIFMNPPFTESVIDSFYGEDYFRGSAEYSYYDERDAGKYARYVWDRRVAVLRGYADGGNFLDVGAAFGGLMSAASPFYTTYGIEPSEYAASHAKKTFGDRIHTGTLDDHPFHPGFFSVITMIEVMEHLPEPGKAVRECSRLLRKGGVLLVQTANMDGMQARMQKGEYAYFMPGHLCYFTRKNLTVLLLAGGFSRVVPYFPVEFGLLPKLLKSRYTFKTVTDYRRWLRITFYHYLSKIHAGNFAATSSMVLYAVK